MAKLAIEKRYNVIFPTVDHVHIAIVGAGGTGSYALEQAMSVAAHMRNSTTRVTVQIVDKDIVKPHNIGRSNFVWGDKGKYKVFALQERYATYGELLATPRFLARNNIHSLLKWPSDTRQGLKIVVGCVDNAYARNYIDLSVRNDRSAWWIDAGNAEWSGQVLVGNAGDEADIVEAMKIISDLPLPSVQIPALLDEQAHEIDPSIQDEGCEINMANGAQSLFVNRQAAVIVGQVLYDMIVTRKLNYHRVDYSVRPYGATTRFNTKSNLTF